MLDQVEVTVAQQPLPRLQAVGSTNTVFPFIYELDWGPRESFSVPRLLRHGSRGPSVRLLPGTGDELIRPEPLVRPLVELHWTRMVAELNGVATAELGLHRHLFGSNRVLPPGHCGPASQPHDLAVIRQVLLHNLGGFRGACGKLRSPSRDCACVEVSIGI